MRIAASVFIATLLTSVLTSGAHAGNFQSPSLHCATPISSNPNAQPDILGTAPMPIRAGRFATDWARATTDASGSPLMTRLVAPARSLCREQQLAFVQSAVNRQIHWRSDTTQWGYHDYWASAAETLANGVGDEEDVAIVKLQALRTLGFDPRNLFLTFGRDTVGGPLVVLVARLGTQYFILDHNGGKPWNANERRTEFEPSISFGPDHTWVHTRRAYAGGTSGAIFAARR
ncbi:MAG: transglutaminase-like cysteine peptidase [Sphingomicrobium sp.]